MARSDDKLARAAHIKRHTLGTSNEISLSVLDAARNKLDAGQERQGGSGRLPRPSFSLPRPSFGVSLPRKAPKEKSRAEGLHGRSSGSHGAWSARVAEQPGVRSSASTGLPVESFTGASGEISRRKRLRRVAAFAAAGVAVVAVVAAVGSAGAWWAARTQSQTQGAAQLQDAFAYLAEADESLAAFDESYNQVFGDGGLPSLRSAAPSRGALVAEPEDAQTADRLERLSLTPLPEAMEAASAALQASGVQVEMALSQLQDNDDREAASQVSASLTRKQEMLSAAGALQLSAAGAAAALSDAVQGWNALVEADELARSAVSALGGASEDQIRESSEQGSAAIVRFQEAQTLLAQAAQAYPVCSLDAVQDYVQLRLQALDQAQASNQALLDGDTEAAVEHNDRYNELDAQAAEDAQNLPTSMESHILQVFLDDAAAACQAYEQARVQAAASDAFIRDYLGTSQ